MKTPISLIIDDGTPMVHLYYHHRQNHMTDDGRPLSQTVPLSFLHRFCDTVERFGIAGKFSIVPYPAGLGCFSEHIEGVSDGDRKEWIQTVKNRLSATFSFCPEMITHTHALLPNGTESKIQEADWSNTQNEETLYEYICRALSMLKSGGIECCGVSSPWDFGTHVMDAYVSAVSRAVKTVYNNSESWCLCTHPHHEADIHPTVVQREENRKTVLIPSTVDDYFWQTIHSPRKDTEYIHMIADRLITEDGKSGDITEALNNRSVPVILTHYQALYSNGTEAGLSVLREVARRIETHYAHVLQWTSFDTLMNNTLQNIR